MELLLGPDIVLGVFSDWCNFNIFCRKYIEVI